MKAAVRESERGQILVLIVLALVGMLGFTALAIDVGMVYSDRRTDQNAADAAAYAGASYIGKQDDILGKNNKLLKCSTFLPYHWDAATQASITQALNNSFKLTAADKTAVTMDYAAPNEVWLTCENGSSVRDYVDVHVRITKKVNTSLVHLFNSGEMINTVDSVVRIYSVEVLAADTAILALNKNCESSDNCLTLDGSHDIKVKKGNVVSNSDIMKNGHSGTIVVEDGNIYYHDDFVYNASKTPEEQVSPAPLPSSGYTELAFDLTDQLRAACSTYTGYSEDSIKDKKTGDPTGDVDADTATVIGPGKYKDIRVTTANAHLTLEPGLYCINSLVVTSSGKGTYAIDGVDVTFFMDSDAGDFHVGGDSYIRLKARINSCDDTPVCPHPNPVEGLLLWSAVDQTTNKSRIELIGGAFSEFEGSLVAPKTTIDIGGNVTIPKDAVVPEGAPAIEYKIQVIAYEIKIHGGATISILYNNDYTPQLDPSLSLFE